MNLIFQMEKTSVTKKVASNNPCFLKKKFHICYNKHNKRMYQLLLGKKYFSLELNLHSRNAASNSSNSIEHETSSFTLMYYACSLLYFHPFFLVAIAQRQLQSAMADIS